MKIHWAPLIVVVASDADVVQVISCFIGQLENGLSDFNKITAIGFVIADLE